MAEVVLVLMRWGAFVIGALQFLGIGWFASSYFSSSALYSLMEAAVPAGALLVGALMPRCLLAHNVARAAYMVLIAAGLGFAVSELVGHALRAGPIDSSVIHFRVGAIVFLFVFLIDADRSPRSDARKSHK